MTTQIHDERIDEILEWTNRRFGPGLAFGDNTDKSIEFIISQMGEDGIDTDEAELAEVLALGVAGRSDWTDANSAYGLRDINGHYCWYSRTEIE